MNTIHTARTEKNLQDKRQEYLSAKFVTARNQRISHYKSEIEKEKANVIESINQNLFDMAAMRIRRIEELQERIHNLYK